MGIQVRMLDIVWALINKRWSKVRVENTTSKSRQTKVPQEQVQCVTLFLMAINDNLDELGSRVDGSTETWCTVNLPL